MSTPVGNSAANASGNGPALGYSLKLWLFILFMLICVISINMFTCFILLLKVIEILLVYTFNFGIKLCPKLPKFLTSKPGLASLVGFACSVAAERGVRAEEVRCKPPACGCGLWRGVQQAAVSCSWRSDSRGWIACEFMFY